MPKSPEVAPIAATAKASSLDIKKSQNEAADELRRRRGAAQSEFAGETGMIQAGNSLG